jgi:hypothetical protein
MNSSLLCSEASLLAATLYHGNPDHFREMYTSYEDVAGMLLHINGMFTMGKLK